MRKFSTRSTSRSAAVAMVLMTGLCGVVEAADSSTPPVPASQAPATESKPGTVPLVDLAPRWSFDASPNPTASPSVNPLLGANVEVSPTPAPRPSATPVPALPVATAALPAPAVAVSPTPSPTPSLSAVPAPSPEQSSERVERRAKPERAADRQPDAFLVSTGFYFSSLKETDFNQNPANFASGASPSLELALKLGLSPDWRVKINAGGSYVSLTTSSPTDILLNTNQFLWNLSLDLTHDFSENVAFTLEPGLSRQLFVDRTSFYTLGVEPITIPDLTGILHWGIYHSRGWDVGPDLGIGYLMSGTADDGLSARSGALYRAAITGERQSGDRPWGFSVYVEDRNQDTSVSSASTLQLGINFTFGFGFGQERSEP